MTHRDFRPPRPNADGPHDSAVSDLDITPEHDQTGQQAIVGTDPFLEEYLRSPYDPVNAARMEGRVLGELIRQSPRLRWMRLFSAFIGFALFVVCALLIVDLLRGSQALDPSGLIIAVVFALAGLGMLLRLVRERARP